ncbi:hydrolase [Actibacterium mucosum KCTC 23349]|uniref:Hydrolase n=1 Tax=Actibacterium mucosum KCTC 23349 TaxID=1454373 RepID=A0A037ZGM0_9RHOB|nr:alpha/beta hydrolase [Actibacterium mucosum]KAJ55283.1 hydrolase [Actibacterium mucosum KCTC 23349]
MNFLTNSIAAAVLAGIGLSGAAQAAQISTFDVALKTAQVNGLTVAYREAGDPANPTVLLLHGFPTSSHMFRNLIPELAGDYHVIAPDYVGYGASDMPPADAFDYTFDNLTAHVEGLLDQKGIDTFAAYVMDYGAPVGYRLFANNPERVTGFIIQNGNAYEEGLREFWDPLRAYWADPSAANADALRPFLTIDGTKWQYVTGVADPSVISPDNYWHIQYLLDRPGNQEVQLELFYDYRTNPQRYPQWQELLREHQPPALVVWGANDPIFPAEGAHPYKEDLTDVEFHLLDTGHFALEDKGAVIAAEMLDFLARIDH